MSNDRDADVVLREEFYKEQAVVRIISKNGVPKSRKALEIMVSEGSVAKSGAGVTQQLIDRISFVNFSVHPQQINVRDKATGKIIAVIPR